VNTSTACRYFEIAEQCKCAELRKKTVNYFSKKHSEFSQQREFKELIRSYSELSSEISLSLLRRNTLILLILIAGVFAALLITRLK
jgi:hypothetical protein